MNYKAGDKVKCISLPDLESTWFQQNPITLGKIYICTKIRGSVGYVINDAGIEQGYFDYRFTLYKEISKNILVL
jgi:hypothetical protein